MRDLLKSLDPTVDRDDLENALRACSDLNLIVDVLWLSSGDDEKLAPVVLRACEAFVAEVLDEFMAHLALKDKAPQDHTSLTHGSFLGHFGAEVAAERIKGAVGKSFTAEDYAARFVGLSYTISENPVAHINDFATQSFQALTTFDDEFFHSDPVDYVDRDDVTWVNRRTYARGRARRTE